MADSPVLMEYFVFYDLNTGALLWGTQGAPGDAERQKPDAGIGVLEMPYSAYIGLTRTPGQPDLVPLKEAVHALIDQAAGKVRAQFITTVPGQAETYVYKGAEARAWTVDNDASTPMLSPEAAARNMTIADLAAEVIANEAAWLALGGKIEGARMAAKTAVTAAGNIAEIVTAAQVDWQAVLA